MSTRHGVREKNRLKISLSFNWKVEDRGTTFSAKFPAQTSTQKSKGKAALGEQTKTHSDNSCR